MASRMNQGGDWLTRWENEKEDREDERERLRAAQPAAQPVVTTGCSTERGHQPFCGHTTNCRACGYLRFVNLHPCTACGAEL